MKNNTLEIITLKKKEISNFAKERNLLLDASDAKWVFFLDSDEKITPQLKKEINKVINSPDSFKGYFIKRKIYFLGNCVGQDKVLRLAKKDAGRWKRAVHEVWNIRGQVGILNNYIVHHTADNLHSYIKKMNRYSDLHAPENIKEGKRSGLIKIIINPTHKFVWNMILGRGFVFSMLQSFHSFLSWVKQWELQKN